jgi:hypothetical protein
MSKEYEPSPGRGRSPNGHDSGCLRRRVAIEVNPLASKEASVEANVQ